MQDNDQEPRDAELVNIGMTLLRKSLDYITPGDVFSYLLPALSQTNEDQSQSLRYELFSINNGDWILNDNNGTRIIPGSWLKLLIRHTKMLVLLIELMQDANNKGVVLKADVDKIGKRMKLKPGSVHAYVLRLVSMGFITLLDPEIDGKLYLNCQLHSAPQPSVPVQVVTEDNVPEKLQAGYDAYQAVAESRCVA